MIVSIGQKQDLRSLAAFRFLLGLYIVYDVISRLKNGRLSLAWYTSIAGSFLHPLDSPHGNLLHKVWFYRGGNLVQITLFLLTGFIAFAFSVGYRCNGPLKVSLWLLVVAMQHRNMNVHDGSDTFIRHLLLWSCQLPLAQIWSLDALVESKRGKRKDQVVQPNYSAVWGLRLQIVFMYLGTVLNRTTDLYGWSLSRSSWMPPQLSAVHYSLNSSFASRDCWLGDMVRTVFPVSSMMTLSAMMIESFAPIACLLLGDYAHIPAFLLFMLHFGLFILVNLPNWQFAGMLATLVWVPSSPWDAIQRQLALRFPRLVLPPNVTDSFQAKQKREEDLDLLLKMKVQSRHRPYVTYFFLTYMIYNFCGERKWIAKHDRGDIGEFLRFSQYWVMYGTPPKTSTQTIFVGKIQGDEMDVWEWIRDGHLTPINLENRKTSIWSNMTHVYPSPRWERIFDQWGEQRDTKRCRYFLNQLCMASPFEDLTLIWQHLVVMPPKSMSRFQPGAFPNTVVHVICNK